MSDGVIAPENSLNAASPAGSAPSSQDALFTAFREQKPSRARWALLPAAALVLGAGGWALSRQADRTYRVVTPRGIITVSHGMTPQEVTGLLGKAITLDRTGASECYRYGQPTLVAESFVVYSVCYEDGKLRDVVQRKYSAWQVDPSTGTFVPPSDSTGSAGG